MPMANTQERLAADARLEPRHIGSLENAAGNPTVDVLEQIARALVVDAAELFRPPTNRELPANLKKGRKARPTRRGRTSSKH